MARFHIGVGGRTGLSHFIIMYLDIFQIDSVLPRRLHKPISSYVFFIESNSFTSDVFNQCKLCLG